METINLSVGEPDIIRNALFKIYPFDKLKITKDPMLWEYPFPSKRTNLTRYLENKYQAPIIVTNGAKQALSASFYAMAKMGKKRLGMRTPYWSLLPQLIEHHGLQWEGNYLGSGCNVGKHDAVLLLLPNNPDGFIPSDKELNILLAYCKERKITVIHDAVYYNKIYMPGVSSLPSIGDIQIYSSSKMFGLSGLRVGWAVCKDPEYYKYICEYVEMTTVGVSALAQEYLLTLMNRMDSDSELKEEFESSCSLELFKAKKLFNSVNPNVIRTPDEMHLNPGMFGWVKILNKEALTAANINVIDGAGSGCPGFARINLAVNPSVLEEAVNRINSI